MSEPAKTPPKGVRLWVAVLDLPLSRMGKAVLSALLRYADLTSGECWPSTRTLANLAGTTRETVSRTIGGELVPSGLVAIVLPGGGSNSNRYRVHLDELLTRGERARAERASKRGKPRRTCDAGSQGAVTLDHSAPRSTITGGCDAGSQGAVTGAHTNREGEQGKRTGKGNTESEPARASPSQQQQRAPRVLRVPVPAAAAAGLRLIPAEDEPKPDAKEHAERMAALRGAGIAKAKARTLAAMPWNTTERIRRLKRHVEQLGTRINNPPGMLIGLLSEARDPPMYQRPTGFDAAAEARRIAEAREEAEQSTGPNPQPHESSTAAPKARYRA